MTPATSTALGRSQFLAYSRPIPALSGRGPNPAAARDNTIFDFRFSIKELGMTDDIKSALHRNYSSLFPSSVSSASSVV
ncbi:hypothetical protein [Microcoleus vaginatus]|uniref:hypothetical protein n=1 Tax=Microcoleus vaginatus TaxID=119532 RepID=UPI00403F1851